MCVQHRDRVAPDKAAKSTAFPMFNNMDYTERTKVQYGNLERY